MSNFHPPHNSDGDIAAARESQAARKALALDQGDDDLRWLLSQRQGRRLMWRMLDRAGVFRLSFNSDALAMAFAEGNRNLGNQLLGDVMRLSPDDYVKMIVEAADDAKRYAAN